MQFGFAIKQFNSVPAEGKWRQSKLYEAKHSFYRHGTKQQMILKSLLRLIMLLPSQISIGKVKSDATVCPSRISL
jgi:hypothetical protein